MEDPFLQIRSHIWFLLYPYYSKCFYITKGSCYDGQSIYILIFNLFLSPASVTKNALIVLKIACNFVPLLPICAQIIYCKVNVL